MKQNQIKCLVFFNYNIFRWKMRGRRGGLMKATNNDNIAKYNK
jgi:hypothetical protein